MKTFLRSEEPQALAHARAGGTALHLRNLDAALYDQTLPRLVALARYLGMVSLVVHRTGTERQHVVLSTVALMRAMTEQEMTFRALNLEAAS